MPLSKPPRNPQGEVVPHDHPEITATDGVIRRISEQWVTPGRDGSPRVSSMALTVSSGHDGGMSVDLERLIMEAGVDPRVHVTTPKHIASVRFEAGDLRAEDLIVGVDPLPENPHHGEVWGRIPPGKFKRLMRQAQWFVALPDVNLFEA